MFLIAILDKLKVKGSVIIGIIGATIAGIPLGVTNLAVLKGDQAGITWKFWESFANFFTVGETSVFGSFIEGFKGFPAGSLFTVIPGAATAAALIYVGVLMMKNNIKSINFSNAINATAAFLTIVVMPLAYSITKGIGVGMIAFTLMSAVAYVIDSIKYAVNKNGETEKPKWEVSVVALVVTALFLVYFFVPTV